MLKSLTSKLLSVRDAYTREHTENGIRFATLIAREMSLTEKEIEFLKLGGLIHDIGKIGIPDVILLKPSSLTPEEYKVMKLHVEIGIELLKDADIPPESFDVLKFHQEKYNGSGYPFGLKGKEIPLLARIYTIADSFEAMIARRVYKRSKSKETALAELEELAGIQFDPNIVPYAVRALSGIDTGSVNSTQVSSELEKVRWSFYYLDFTGAIKGDLFLPTLSAFIEKGDPFCFTVFDIENLFEINRNYGWEKGNEALTKLVRAINSECCAMYDIRDLIIKLMKTDIIDITSPVIFRIGGDEIGVIAPFIPPEEKPKSVVRKMEEEGVKVKFVQMNYPQTLKSIQDVLDVVSGFTKNLALKFNISP